VTIFFKFNVVKDYAISRYLYMILTFFRCIPLIPLFTILALSQSFSHWPVVIIVSVSFWIASVIILFYVLFLCLLHQFLQNLLTRKRRRRKEKPFASCIPIHIYIYKIYPPPVCSSHNPL